MHGSDFTSLPCPRATAFINFRMEWVSACGIAYQHPIEVVPGDVAEPFSCTNKHIRLLCDIDVVSIFCCALCFWQHHRTHLWVYIGCVPLNLRGTQCIHKSRMETVVCSDTYGP